MHGCIKKLNLSFLCTRRLVLGGWTPPFCRPNSPKNTYTAGKTDQDRIKNAGTLTGIFEWLLKTSSFQQPHKIATRTPQVRPEGMLK